MYMYMYITFCRWSGGLCYVVKKLTVVQINSKSYTIALKLRSNEACLIASMNRQNAAS